MAKNATPIDFAYAVHTKIGDTAVVRQWQQRRITKYFKKRRYDKNHNIQK